MNEARSPDSLAADVLRFARAKLGPGAEAMLSDPAAQVLVLSRIRSGFDLEDAVLAEVHRAAADNRRLADEFLAYFLNDLMQLGHRFRSSALERFLDTGDLVQSVVGDLWPNLQSVRFETRGRFLSYLSKRLNWKASDRARRLTAGNRREDRRVDVEPGDLNRESGDPSPSVAAAREEEREMLALAILRLPERDRRIITLFLKGASVQDIAAEVGLSYDAARMALQRAIRKARQRP